MKWLKDGDRNTTLFHTAAKVRRSLNNFRVTLKEGLVTNDREVMGNMAVSYFEDLLGQFSSFPMDNYFDNIQPNITMVDNDQLTGLPSADEIWSAVQNLPKDSAPGLDGFTGCFYQKYWSIIGTDVTNAIQHFFKLRIRAS